LFNFLNIKTKQMRLYITFSITLLAFFLAGMGVVAQQATLKGLVKDAYTNEPLPFVNIVVEGTNTGTTTNEAGAFIFENLKPGFIRLQLSSIGFENKLTEEINLSVVRSNYIEVIMQQKTTQIEEVVVTAGSFVRRGESPVSLRRIGIEQIEKGAGASRDLAKVLQSFPGVGSSASFRNDLIVRGGGPSENRFFLEGIEIPVFIFPHKGLPVVRWVF
jgi:hypothetical protein